MVKNILKSTKNYFSTLSKNKEKLMAVYDQNKNDTKKLMKCAKKNVDETLEVNEGAT